MAVATGVNSPGSSPPQQYEYEAQTLTGQAIRGTLEAISAAAANAQLTSLNLRVLSVNPAAVGRRPRRAAFGPDDFIIFNQQLAHMTAAGLPIDRGLRLIAADLNSGRVAAAASAVAGELEQGASLHDAFARHASRFPDLYARLVEAGVQANNLPGLLFNFGRHLELKSRLRRMLWRVLSYPGAVLIALSVVLVFISLVILPQMSAIYADFETTLPWLTEMLIWAGPKIPYVIGAIFVIVIALAVTMAILRQIGRGGVIVDFFVLPLPLIGPVIRRSMLARWCDSLRIGAESGLDLPRAISLAAEAVGSPRLRGESDRLIGILSSGGPAMSFSGVLLPPAVPAAIEFGSRSGDLVGTLATLTRMYEQQAEQRLRAVPPILTPILLAFIATVIGVTILAMFLPLIQLIQSVSGGS